MKHRYAWFLVPVTAVLIVLLITLASQAWSGGLSYDPPTRKPRLLADEAIALAVNDLETTAEGYRLHRPRHVADLMPGSVRFIPRHGGPAWAWQLTAIMAGHAPVPGVQVGEVSPLSRDEAVVIYPRGRITERYLARKASLEQQFVINQPLPLDGADLTIIGAVRSAGTFEKVANGWQWRTTEGAVHLGDVRAYDAAGHEVSARMTVSATETRIVVEGDALADAVYPVVVDPEIGANDFRLSDMGPNQYKSFAAYYPAVAYNSTNDEYLVVWEGDDGTSPLVDEEFEIFAQRVDAATGAELGYNDFRLSEMGPDGDQAHDARGPAVAYNSVNNEYLVVWQGNDGPPLHGAESEIYGQRVDAATGAEIGDNDFRLSDMGADGNPFYNAYAPAVAYNSNDNEYLVVWEGHDEAAIDHNYEIYGQRVDAATGAQVGDNDFRLSDMGPEDEPEGYRAIWPAVAYNSANNQYLVVWQGEDAVFPLVPGEWEIFGQRVDASTGAEIGTNDLQLSQAGPVQDPDYDASLPAVAYNSTDNEYLVVWMECDSSGGLTCGQSEIYGQRVAGSSGAENGADFALSDMGPASSTLYNAHDPAVAYCQADNEYLVVWWGNDDLPQLYWLEHEIYGQRVDAATGAQVGDNDFRLSDMGPDGDSGYFANYPAVACSSERAHALVVWEGDDDTPPLESGEVEIFGQRFATSGDYPSHGWYLPLVTKTG